MSLCRLDLVDGDERKGDEEASNRQAGRLRSHPEHATLSPSHEYAKPIRHMEYKRDLGLWGSGNLKHVLNQVKHLKGYSERLYSEPHREDIQRQSGSRSINLIVQCKWPLVSVQSLRLYNTPKPRCPLSAPCNASHPIPVVECLSSTIHYCTECVKCQKLSHAT